MSKFISKGEQAKFEWSAKIDDFRRFITQLEHDDERKAIVEAILENFCFAPHVGCGRILKTNETCHCENDE